MKNKLKLKLINIIISSDFTKKELESILSKIKNKHKIGHITNIVNSPGILTELIPDKL